MKKIHKKTLLILIGFICVLAFFVIFSGTKSKIDRVSKQTDIIYAEVQAHQVSNAKIKQLIDDNQKLLGNSQDLKTQHLFKQNKQKLTSSLNIVALRPILQKIKFYRSVPEEDKAYASAIRRYQLLDRQGQVKLPMSKAQLIKDRVAINDLRKLYVDKDFIRVKDGVTEAQVEEVSAQIDGLSSARLKEFFRTHLRQVFQSMTTAQSLSDE